MQAAPLTNLFTEMKDVGTVTEPNRRLLTSQDWFFSHLFRETVQKYFEKIGESVPEAILERFKKHDKKNKYRGFDDSTKNAQAQTAENPQAMDVQAVTEVAEAEIGYQLSLFNQKMAKNKDMGFIRNLHERLIHSAKSLTVKLVESSQPICSILGKHDSVNKENVILLLTRL